MAHPDPSPLSLFSSSRFVLFVFFVVANPLGMSAVTLLERGRPCPAQRGSPNAYCARSKNARAPIRANSVFRRG